MARSRALITPAERRYLAGDEKQQRYEATSRIRARIRDELPTDLDLLAEHHPELYAELRTVVCDHEPATDQGGSA